MRAGPEAKAVMAGMRERDPCDGTALPLPCAPLWSKPVAMAAGAGLLTARATPLPMRANPTTSDATHRTQTTLRRRETTGARIAPAPSDSAAVFPLWRSPCHACSQWCGEEGIPHSRRTANRQQTGIASRKCVLKGGCPLHRTFLLEASPMSPYSVASDCLELGTAVRQVRGYQPNLRIARADKGSFFPSGR